MKNSIALYIFISLICFSNCKQKTETTETIPSNSDLSSTAKINELIQKSPYADSLYYKRAIIHYDEGNIDSVYADLNRAIFLNKNKKEYYFFLADTYLENAQSKESKAVMEKAMAIFPDDIATQLKNVRLNLILKEFPLATIGLNKIFLQDPQNAEAFYLAGHTSYETGDTASAINAYQKAVDINPEFKEAWIQLGDVMSERKNKLSIRYYDNALRLDSNDVETMHNKAYAYQMLNQENEAFELYKKICTRFSDYEPAFYNIGIIYANKDSIAKAIEHFTISIGMSPMEASSYYQRGLCYEKQKKRVEAKADFSKATALEPEWKEAKEAIQRINK